MRGEEAEGVKEDTSRFLRSSLLPSFAGEQTLREAAAFYLRASVFYGLV